MLRSNPDTSDNKGDKNIVAKIKYDYPRVSDSESGKYYSCDVVPIKGFDAWIEVGREIESKNSLTEDSLSFWIRFESPAHLDDWYFYAEMQFKLVSHIEGETVTQDLNDVVCKKSPSIGFYDFEDWKTVRDTRRGFCRSDTIRLEVLIKSLEPFTVVNQMPRILEPFKNNSPDDKIVLNLQMTYFQSPAPDFKIRFVQNKFLSHSSVLRKSRLLQQLIDTQVKEITLSENFTYSSLLIALHFMYTNEMFIDVSSSESSSSSSTSNLLITAYVLKIDPIIKLCLQFTPTPALLPVLHFSIAHKQDDLTDKLWIKIEEDCEAVLMSPQFLQISKQLLSQILQRDHLQASEEMIYERSICWAKNACREIGFDTSGDDIRSVMGDLVYQIRFPSMKLKYFKDHVTQTGILNSDEEQQIDKLIRKQQIFTKILFNTEPRNSSK